MGAAPVVEPSGALATNPGESYQVAVLCCALVLQAGPGAGTLVRGKTLLGLVVWPGGVLARGVQMRGVAWR